MLTSRALVARQQRGAEAGGAVPLSGVEGQWDGSPNRASAGPPQQQLGGTSAEDGGTEGGEPDHAATEATVAGGDAAVGPTAAPQPNGDGPLSPSEQLPPPRGADGAALATATRGRRRSSAGFGVDRAERDVTAAADARRGREETAAATHAALTAELADCRQRIAALRSRAQVGSSLAEAGRNIQRCTRRCVHHLRPGAIPRCRSLRATCGRREKSTRRSSGRRMIRSRSSARCKLK